MDEQLLIVEYFLDYGRNGDLQGLCICTESEYEQIIGKEIYWGEVLGKHSEVYHTMGKENLTIKSSDQGFIKQLREVLGVTWSISGHYPFEKLRSDDDEDEGDDE